MEVFELIAATPNGLTVQEIVNATNHSKTSIYRIACSLEETGYLHKNEITGKYTLSRKLFILGLSTLGTTTIMEHAYEPMRHLRDCLKETVVLGTIINNRIIILEQITGAHHFSFILKPGTEINLHASAPGKAIVANLEPEEKRTIIENIEFIRYNENTITSRTEFTKELEEVTAKGYAVDWGEELSGVRCIGAPVFNQNGKVAAAVWVTGPSERLADDIKDDFSREVISCANEISHKMGYNPKMT